ncbi:DUF4350 domain-containing protein [Streptomyces sp. NPDC097619]|uniref:DUF4350 domain-containing protein n=1 Tax=Streptomyces sp. NPDC097619 TaxID=3157228 RepID=UPI00332D15BA
MWRDHRGLVLAAVVLVLAGLLLALFRTGTRHGTLDPRSADPQGSRAVAELLARAGVRTRVVTTTAEAAAAAGPGTTLLVTVPDLLGPAQQTRLKAAMDLSGGRTVLLAPVASLAALAPGTTGHPPAGDTVLAPDCPLPAARRAGSAATGDGPRYTDARPGAVPCYPADGSATLLLLPGPSRTAGETVLLGSPAPLLNENLAEQGNASLALQLLGSRPDLVWYLPSLDDPALTDPDQVARKSFTDLVPDGWNWALLQLAVAAVLAALWRARRLGPLVTEPLPVVVPAAEAAEGRARLYRAADARDRAATVLRTATRGRLATVLGVPAARAHDPAVLLPAVSARRTATATGGATDDPAALLFGPPPTDDAALLALTERLDALEREVRTS